MPLRIALTRARRSAADSPAHEFFRFCLGFAAELAAAMTS
jgi:hypothetical protein